MGSLITCNARRGRKCLPDEGSPLSLAVLGQQETVVLVDDLSWARLRRESLQRCHLMALARHGEERAMIEFQDSRLKSSLDKRSEGEGLLPTRF